MPSFRSGRVGRVLSERPGLQRVGVRLDGDTEDSFAINYPDVTGPVAVGDEIVCNTTAVELGLGTGGWHIVHWNLARRSFTRSSGGHIIKVRYTPFQVDVAAVEEPGAAHHETLRDAESIDGMPVLIGGLHSLVAACAAGFRYGLGKVRADLAYVMTDAGALPLALSDLVADLRSAGLLATTVTVGQAFGGDLEAVHTTTGLLAARHAAGAAAAVVSMGPGVVGTGTRLGFSAMEVRGLVDTVRSLGGHPVLVVRASGVDARKRHRGISHHTLRVLETLPADCDVVLPAGEWLEMLLADLDPLDIEPKVVDPGDSVELMASRGIAPTSMGRGVKEDPLFWEAGAVAGIHAARLLAT